MHGSDKRSPSLSWCLEVQALAVTGPCSLKGKPFWPLLLLIGGAVNPGAPPGLCLVPEQPSPLYVLVITWLTLLALSLLLRITLG